MVTAIREGVNFRGLLELASARIAFAVESEARLTRYLAVKVVEIHSKVVETSARVVETNLKVVEKGPRVAEKFIHL